MRSPICATRMKRNATSRSSGAGSQRPAACAERYDSGYSAYLEVLDAQRTLNVARLELVRNRHLYLDFTVDLMNALGGGWSADTQLAGGADQK